MKKQRKSQKDKKAQETQWLEGMPKSQERVITKIKWACPSKAMKKQIKEEQQKKRWKTQTVELVIITHVDNISVQKKTSFSQTKPQAFSRALHFGNP
jgi:hypothetical protein